MRESAYRASRVCRLLGNPVVFGILGELLEQDGQTPSELGKALRRSVQTVSTHLAKLRTADLVRYDTVGRRTCYQLKHPHEIHRLFMSLQNVVSSSTKVAD